MKYDLIIVTKSDNPQLIKVTQNCINSARQDDAYLNVIIVETGSALVNYDKIDQNIKYSGEFNYNRAFNLGLKYTQGDVYILANNDIIFYPGWSQIGEQMIINEFDSASALSQDPRHRRFTEGDWIYEGYEIGTYLVGWCIFITGKAMAKLGKLDESFDFWYSDNIYADQLISVGLRHGLFCNIRVDHITSATLRTIPPKIQRKYSYESVYKYKAIQKLIRHA